MGIPLLLACLIGSASAGDWSIVNETTLKFEGRIDNGEYDRFAKVFHERISEIHVDSVGGLTEEAIRIAQAISKRPVKIVARRRCLSSCANYFFVAGKEREIRRAVVGFHGNVKACFGSEEKRRKTVADYKRRGLSEDNIARNIASQDREIADEAALLEAAGVSQALFDRSCLPDKGKGDGKVYDFLFPKPETFAKYGLKGIVGVQDEDILKRLDWPLLGDPYLHE